MLRARRVLVPLLLIGVSALPAHRLRELPARWLEPPSGAPAPRAADPDARRVAAFLEASRRAAAPSPALLGPGRSAVVVEAVPGREHTWTVALGAGDGAVPGAAVVHGDLLVGVLGRVSEREAEVLPSDHRSFRVLAGCAGAEAPEDAFVVLGSGRGRAEARFPSRLAALRAGAEVATRAQELVPGGLRIGALETAPPTTEAVLRLHPSWPLLFHVTVVRAAGARPVPPAVPARTAATLGTRADASALRRSRAFRAAAPVPDGSPVVAGGRLAGLARSGRCVLLSDVRFRARVALLRAGAGGRLAIAGLAEARGDGNRGDAAALRLDGARAAPGDFVVTAPSGLPAGLLLGRVTGEGPVLEPEPGGGACEALAREPQ